MKVKLLLAALFCGSLFFSSLNFAQLPQLSTASAATKYETTDVLKVRTGPGTGYTKIGQLGKGQSVSVLDTVGS